MPGRTNDTTGEPGSKDELPRVSSPLGLIWQPAASYRHSFSISQIVCVTRKHRDDISDPGLTVKKTTVCKRTVPMLIHSHKTHTVNCDPLWQAWAKEWIDAWSPGKPALAVFLNNLKYVLEGLRELTACRNWWSEGTNSKKDTVETWNSYITSFSFYQRDVDKRCLLPQFPAGTPTPASAGWQALVHGLH